MKAANDQGPIQLSHLLSNALLLFRWMLNAGNGRAFDDRIRLPSRPGPHQRSCQPADSIQLPTDRPRYVPSGRISSSSNGSETSEAFRFSAKWLPTHDTPVDSSPSSLGVYSNERMMRGSLAALAAMR